MVVSRLRFGKMATTHSDKAFALEVAANPKCAHSPMAPVIPSSCGRAGGRTSTACQRIAGRAFVTAERMNEEARPDSAT